VICAAPPPSNPVDYNTVIGDSSSASSKCDTCGKSDPVKTLVSCDNCKLEFHFFCLVPPLKYSPKRRGYSWFCANCDDAISSVDIDLGGSKAMH